MSQPQNETVADFVIKASQALEHAVIHPAFAERMMQHGVSADRAYSPELYKRACDVFEQLQQDEYNAQQKQASAAGSINDLIDSDLAGSQAVQGYQYQNPVLSKSAALEENRLQHINQVLPSILSSNKEAADAAFEAAEILATIDYQGQQG